MPGNYHFAILFLLTVVRLPGYTQVLTDPESGAEELLYRDEASEVPIELFENEMDRIIQPINLNTATTEQLAASRLFTPFQIHLLLKYRNEFGTLYSVFELAGLTGFRMERLRELAPYLTVEMGRVPIQRPVNRHMVIINTAGSYPETAGYRNIDNTTNEPAYVGLPIKTSLRIKTHIGQSLTLGMAFEKDAGEKFLNGVNPEFLSKNVTYRGTRIIKQLVLGDFQLQHGLGLVNGSGFMHTLEGFQIRLCPISKLKPYASLNEYRFERGIGCQLALRKLEIMMWSSYQQMDLSLSSLPANLEKTNWIDFRRTTGLHRTAGELNGHSLAYRIHAGIQATVRHENLTLGTMIGSETTGLTRRGTDSLKITVQPYIHHPFSLHGQWHRKKLEVMVEIASGDWNSTAFLAVCSYYFSDFLHGIILVHRYGSAYHGIQSSSYASGSNLNNENGVAVHLHAEPGVLFNADFLVELFRHPSPRYLCNVPSKSYRYSLTLKNNSYNRLRWRFKMVKKVWQVTSGANVDRLRTLHTPQVVRLDFQIFPVTESMLIWQSRLVFSLFSEHGKTNPGYAAVQQLSLKSIHNMNCKFQFVVFHVEDWDNRIYLYEPGLYYDFNFPVYYGSGQKISSVLAVKAGGKVTISVKGSLVTFHDRDFTGSGNDMILGNKKWDLKLQLRLNL